jgi:hypothetical protein
MLARRGTPVVAGGLPRPSATSPHVLMNCFNKAAEVEIDFPLVA